LTPPDLITFCLFTGQAGLAKSVFYSFQRDFNLIAEHHFQFTLGIPELLNGYDAFGLQAGVDDDNIGLDINNRTDDYGASP
jgi:hypothetical protein